MKRIIIAGIIIVISGISCIKRNADIFFTDKNEKINHDEFNYYYSEGLRLKLLGNNPEALRNFEKCIKVDPENDATYFQIASVLLQNGNIDKGKNYLIKAYKLNSLNVWYSYLLTQIYQQIGSIDSSIYFAEKASNSLAESEILKLKLIELYRIKGENDKIAPLVNEIIKKKGINKQNSIIIINAMVQLGYYQDAEKILKQLYEEFPEENLYMRMLADIYVKKHDNNTAYKIYKQFLENYNNRPDEILWVIDFLQKVKRYDDLIKFTEELIKNENIENREKINLLSELINNDELIRCCENELEYLFIEFEKGSKNEEVSLLLRVDLYQKSGRIDAAIKRLKEIIKKNRENYYAWEKLLILLEENRLYNDLYKEAKEAATEFNLSILAKLLFVRAAIEIEDYKSAMEEIRKAKVIAGNDKETIIQCLLIEADLYYRMKDYNKAFEALENVLKNDSINIIGLNNYAYYLAEANKSLKKAEEMINTVIKLEPGNPIYLDTYAWILYKKGLNKKAEKVMEEVIIKLKGDDPEFFEHYGYILMKLKKCKEAIMYWKMAIEKDNKKSYLEKEINSCLEKRK